MLKKLHKPALLLPIFLAIAGCSEKYSPRESIVDDQKAAAKLAVKAPQSVLERQAYEKGGARRTRRYEREDASTRSIHLGCPDSPVRSSDSRKDGQWDADPCT